jgi:hypothetical protein
MIENSTIRHFTDPEDILKSVDAVDRLRYDSCILSAIVGNLIEVNYSFN